MAWDCNSNIVAAAKWLKRKSELIEEKSVLIRRRSAINASAYAQVYRGGIFDCELGLGNIGGEKNKTRPVLVISKNSLNRGHTVLVVPLSTKFELDPNTKLPKYRNHYLLKKVDYSFLDKDSVAKFEDIRNVDVVRLRKFRGNISHRDMLRMKKNLLFMCGY